MDRKESCEDLRQMLLAAPDSQLDASMFPLIRAWSSPPTSLQILEVLDQCIFGSLASGLVVTSLQIFLNGALQEEGKTLEEITPFATWRKVCG